MHPIFCNRNQGPRFCADGGGAKFKPAPDGAQGKKEERAREIARLLDSQDAKERLKGLNALSKNANALLYLAVNSRFKDSRLGAVERLAGNVNALRGVLNCSVFEDARNAAKQRILELGAGGPHFVKELTDLLIRTQH